MNTSDNINGELVIQRSISKDRVRECSREIDPSPPFPKRISAKYLFMDIESSHANENALVRLVLANGGYLYTVVTHPRPEVMSPPEIQHGRRESPRFPDGIIM